MAHGARSPSKPYHYRTSVQLAAVPAGHGHQPLALPQDPSASLPCCMLQPMLRAQRMLGLSAHTQTAHADEQIQAHMLWTWTLTIWIEPLASIRTCMSLSLVCLWESGSEGKIFASAMRIITAQTASGVQRTRPPCFWILVFFWHSCAMPRLPQAAR